MSFEPHTDKLWFNLVCRFEGQISGKNIEIGIIDEKRVFKYVPSPCISESSVDVNAQGPGFYQGDYDSGNVIVVGFVPKNCFPLAIVWLPLSKSIDCQPLQGCFTLISVYRNFYAVPK